MNYMRIKIKMIAFKILFILVVVMPCNFSVYPDFNFH